MVPLKYLSNISRTVEMSLIHSEINLVLTWSKNCNISNGAANQDSKFEITATKSFFSENFIYSRYCKTITINEIKFEKSN